MHSPDLIRLSLAALREQPLRSLLTVLGIAIGIAAVVLLTAIGEGVYRFTLAEFTQFGTNLIGINPGKVTTAGMPGGILNTVRPLSLDDARALRQVPGVLASLPVVQGNAAVSANGRSRRVILLGVGPAVPEVWQIQVARGHFLPDDQLEASRPLAVLGSTAARELFPGSEAIGQSLRIAGERFRVVGIMASKGQMLGFDLDDAVYIPTGRAMALFNQEGLMEIDILYQPELAAKTVAGRLRQLLTARHGREDFTIITQDEMLSVLGSVLDNLTLLIGGLGAISLLVGGVGIVTIMTIAISERTSEIGLLRAIGATSQQILHLFLAEAVALAAVGGLLGLAGGAGIAWLLGALLPSLPTHVSWQYALAAEVLALAIGLAAGVLPARHASRMDPVTALRTE